MPKVLIIDDDVLVLRSLERGLKMLGWDVATAEEPYLEPGVDIILSDWDPHGPAMVAINRHITKIPLLLMTGGDGIDAEETGLFVSYKPVTAIELDRQLRNMLFLAKGERP